jgi:hypothetical protein
MEKVNLNPVEHLFALSLMKAITSGAKKFTFHSSSFSLPTVDTLTLIIMRKALAFRKPINKFETVLLACFDFELKKRKSKIY